jgi:hypothetical protein
MPAEELKVSITGDASGLDDASKKAVSSLNKIDNSAGKLKSSLDALQQKLKAKTALLVSETDLTRIKTYQGEISLLKKEIEGVSKVTLGQTTSNIGNIAAGANAGFSALRKLAYIIPGVGIAGLIAGFGDFFLELIKGGNIIDNVSRKLGAFSKLNIDRGLIQLKDIFKDAAKSAGEDSVKLEVFKNKLNDLSIPASERNKILKQYNSIADDTNKIDATQINNLDLINRKIDAQNTLILQRALSTAAMSKVTEAANKLIENEVKLQEELTKGGYKDLADYDKKQKEVADNRAKLFKKDPKAFEQAQDLNKVKAGLDGVVTPALKAAQAFDKDKVGLDSLVSSVKSGRGELQKLVGNLSGLITIPGLTTEKVQDKQTKGQKFAFLFDQLPFDPNGNLKPENRAQLLNAIDKFQKDFSGILQGALFTGNADERIQQAKTFDLKLKAGKVDLDVSRLSEALDKAFKPEDLMPPADKLEELPKLVVDQYIRGFQNESERLKGLSLFGDLTFANDLSAQIDLFKTRIKQLGAQVPGIIQATGLQGQPIEIRLEDLIDTSKISNPDALDALKKAFENIKGFVFDQKDELQRVVNQAIQSVEVGGFSTIGESIGEALTGTNVGDAFKAFEQMLGDAVQGLGKQIIALNVAALAAKKALKLTFANPAIGIAAGIALVAVGTALKALTSKGIKGFAKGGMVPGQGSGDTVPAMLTPGEFVVPKKFAKLAAMMFDGGFKLPKMNNNRLHFAEGGFVPNIERTSPVQRINNIINPTPVSFPDYLPVIDMSFDKLRILYRRANKNGDIFGR